MINAFSEVEPLPPLPPLPPDSAVLAVRPGPDRVHTILRLNRNVTSFSDDGQKLLLHMLTDALTQIEKAVKGMNRIEIASRLAKLERHKQAIAIKKNGS